MRRTILFVSNDIPTREIAAMFFIAHGYTCQCVNCDEKLLTHVDRLRPHALITEVSLRSRFYSPYDTDAVLAQLAAARCKIPHLPVLVIGRDASESLAAQCKKLGMLEFCAYPLNLVNMLDLLRDEFRRTARLKCTLHVGPVRRGRPRKYLPSPPFAPFQPVPAIPNDIGV